MSFVQGTIVRINAIFTTEEEPHTPIEPTEVTATVSYPDPGSSSGAKITTTHLLSLGEVFNDPDIAGGYYCDIDTTPAAGTWVYSFESSGPSRGVGKSTFHVRRKAP